MIHKLREALKFHDKKIKAKTSKINDNMELIKKFHCVKEIVNN